MIENILGSKTNLRIIRLLTRYPNKDFSIPEIGKFTEAKGGNLHRALKKVVVAGVVLKNKRKYRINYSHFLISSLKHVFEEEEKSFQNIDQKELNIVSDFANELLKKYTDVKDVVLFGSVARGMYSPKSDIDLIIIKEEISNKEELQVTKLAGKYKRKIQFFLCTPKDFEKSKEPMIKEAKKEGVSVVSCL